MLYQVAACFYVGFPALMLIFLSIVPNRSFARLYVISVRVFTFRSAVPADVTSSILFKSSSKLAHSLITDIFGHLILSFMGSGCGMASVEMLPWGVGDWGAEKSEKWGASWLELSCISPDSRSARCTRVSSFPHLILAWCIVSICDIKTQLSVILIGFYKSLSCLIMIELLILSKVTTSEKLLLVMLFKCQNVLVYNQAL